MPTVAQVRAAITAALADITDVRWYDKWPGQVIGPAGVVRRQTITYGVDLDGDVDATYAISVYLPLTDVEAMTALMDELLSSSGSNSIYAAIEADPTLGGVVAWAEVIRATEDSVVSLSQVEHLSATVTLSIGGA